MWLLIPSRSNLIFYFKTTPGIAGASRSHHAQHSLTSHNIQSLQPHQEGYDIILSSGFLAFAAHAGFLQAIEDLNLPVRGVMGTSSGALTGALYAAGYSPREIAHELGKIPPIQRIRMSRRPWRGVLSLDPAMKELRALLPPRFEDLQRDFAVGVVGRGSQSIDDPQPYHELIDSGSSLAAACVASAAVPVLFSPVDIPSANHGPYMDGGVACRIGLDLWRRHRKQTRGDSDVNPALVHLIGRSSPFSGNDSLDNLGKKVAVVRSPKSRASLWNLNGYDIQFEAARERAYEALRPLADAKKTTTTRATAL
jgi:predicted acylesterase/phospholipase RssA